MINQIIYSNIFSWEKGGQALLVNILADKVFSVLWYKFHFSDQFVFAVVGVFCLSYD